MFRTRTALGAAFLFTCIHTSVDARPITLEEALAAGGESPSIGVAAADVEEAEGRLDQAGVHTYNPTIGVAAGPAYAPGVKEYELEVSLAHSIEIGGKRSARRRAAKAERDAARQTLAATRIASRAEVRRAFHTAVIAQERVAVTTEDETAARELRDAASERLRLGAATQTELNVALASFGRATAVRKAAERDLVRARAELGAAIGSAEDLEPTGPLPSFEPIVGDEAALVAAALAARPDLAAVERSRAARAAEVDLAGALAWPDPEVSVAWSRSEVEEIDAIVAGLRIDLPLWNRNQGGRRAARASLRRAGIELEAARRAVEREVRAAFRRYRAAMEGVGAFDRAVIGTLDENLQLARESLVAGKLNLLELNAVRRALVESQLSYLDAVGEAVEAAAALELAVGRPLETTP